MAKRRKTQKKAKTRGSRAATYKAVIRTARAPAHGELDNDFVHVFVDDQNLFFGIVNAKFGPDFRIDFGRLLLEVAKGSDGRTRAYGSAYIAGVIPDDDSFWAVAEARGFVVRRGYMGTGKRSKQDDSYLICDMMATLYEEEGPAGHRVAAQAMLGRGIALPKFSDLSFVEEKSLAVVTAFANQQAARHRRIIASPARHFPAGSNHPGKSRSGF